MRVEQLLPIMEKERRIKKLKLQLDQEQAELFRMKQEQKLRRTRWDIPKSVTVARISPAKTILITKMASVGDPQMVVKMLEKPF